MVMPAQIGDILEIGQGCKERFVDCQKVPEMEQLNIQLSGISHLSGHYCVGREKPLVHSLFYCVDGEIELSLKTEQYTVSKGQLIIVPAGQPFLLTLKKPYWEMAWFALNDVADWQNIHQFEAGVQACDSGKQLFHLLGHLYYERDVQLRASSIRLLKHYLDTTLKANNVSNEVSKLNQLIRDLEKSLHFQWTVQSMANTVQYSAPHLHRLFQKHYQMSPLQYLIKMRMDRAQYLLKNSTWSLQQIAEQVGYTDVFNFSKRFKKSLGVSPGQYRKE